MDEQCLGRPLKDLEMLLEVSHVPKSASLFTILSDMRSGRRNIVTFSLYFV